MTKDAAKTILCYGDSNTWGSIPDSDFRYPRSVRWTSTLQRLLGDGYEVISEGLCGRTLKSDIAVPEKNGINYILPCVLSHEPLEWVIVMLGTNDVKDRYGLSPESISDNLRETISIIRSAEMENKENLKILIVCPPEIVVPNQGPDERFTLGIEKIKKLPNLYKKVADETNSYFINAGDFIITSTVDGLHFDEAGHLKLAEVIKDFILQNN
jgi:lysophospholipase L1-like esterase